MKHRRTPTYRVACGVSVVAGVLALGIAGGARTAMAQTPSPAPTPVPTTARPVSVVPALPLADAGILPTSAFALFDRLDEFMERNVFSFGIPRLRAHIALTQATERIAELQALEREGQLTARHTKELLAAHRRLVGVAQRVVRKTLAAGNVSRDLVAVLTQTELAAADVLQELEDRVALEIELETPEEEPDAPADAEEEEVKDTVEDGENEEETESADDFRDIAELLADMAEELGDFEEDLLAEDVGTVEAPALPPEILRFLAEQKIAKAERDLFAALAKVEERLAHGKVAVADTELRSVAESALRTARELFAAGNYAAALSVAREARDAAHRLKSGKMFFEPETLAAPQGEERVERTITDLVEKGFFGSAEEERARIRAREVIERVRAKSFGDTQKEFPRGDARQSPQSAEEGERRDAVKREESDEPEPASSEREDRSGSSGSGGGSGSSGDGSSGSGSPGSGSSGSGSSSEG